MFPFYRMEKRGEGEKKKQEGSGEKMLFIRDERGCYTILRSLFFAPAKGLKFFHYATQVVSSS